MMARATAPAGHFALVISMKSPCQRRLIGGAVLPVGALPADSDCRFRSIADSYSDALRTAFR
jgi:hypothetical protein